MVSLQNIIDTFGGESKFSDTINYYNNEAEKNNGIYYLGGRLPIIKTDVIKKSVVENVKKMGPIDGEHYNTYRLMFYNIYSSL